MPKDPGGLKKAQALFKKAGLAFPTLPRDLATRLREVDAWCFSTRDIRMSPYFFGDFVREAEIGIIGDYAILAHAGHGVNSYALHYYLVHGPLNLFLQLSWGGVYEDEQQARDNIKHCFAAADRLLKSATRAGKSGDLKASDPLQVAGSSFYGSRWSAPGAKTYSTDPTPDSQRPLDVIEAAAAWLALRSPPSSRSSPE